MLTYVYSAAFAVVAFAILYMIVEHRKLMAMSEGTQQMSEVALKIRSGSTTFLKTIYPRIAAAALVLAVLIAISVNPMSGIFFIIGLILTTVSVVVGLSISTYANVRTTAKAYENRNEPENIATAHTVSATLQGSKICGIIVEASVILGLVVILVIMGEDSFIRPAGSINAPITAALTGYGLGWSVVAMFCRVAGGIFTKAADIGADLIGKVFMHFKEDDPRNPAVLADLTGDNVSDVASNEADLGESFAATPITCIIAATTVFATLPIASMYSAIAFVLILAIGGLLSAILGLHCASRVKATKKPSRQLNLSMYIAMAGTLLTSAVASYCLFANKELPGTFKLGWATPLVCSLCGILAGPLIGLIAQYFTDSEGKWAKRVAKDAKIGSAICVSTAMGAGLISVFWEVAVVVVFAGISLAVGGPYGNAVMALGMLAFVAQPIGVDAFGPISDNAGGIAENSGLSPEDEKKTRTITDKDDAAGNTTAAIGKGYAIGSAAAVVMSMISSYAMSYGATTVNLLNAKVLLSIVAGGGLVWLFCGLLQKYTGMAAAEMAEEVKKQLLRKEVLDGTVEPDALACIKIGTENALRKMIAPVAIPIIATLGFGFILGPDSLCGALIGVAANGICLAIFFSNFGGLADNAKKRFEAAMEDIIEGMEGYDFAHDAATVGDTIGDWCKDVVAVCIDIFMKIMATTATMLAPMFLQYSIF